MSWQDSRGAGVGRLSQICSAQWGFSLHHWVKFPGPQSHANKMGLFSKQVGQAVGAAWAEAHGDVGHTRPWGPCWTWGLG